MARYPVNRHPLLHAPIYPVLRAPTFRFGSEPNRPPLPKPPVLFVTDSNELFLTDAGDFLRVDP